MIIEAKEIYKSYGDLSVLRGASLEIAAGSIVSIMGRSGAGKSTLLHILGTLDRADSGSLRIDGTEIANLDDRKINSFRNKQIGFVFQFHHLLGEFTALENVCIPAYIGKSNSNAVIDKAKTLLDFLGLSERIDHKPSELSGGEQQRVAVARALINNPKVVFADEPTGNLDQQSAEELHQLILKLKHEFGQTFVIVTHNKDLAELSDRILEIENGQILPYE